MDVSQEEKSRIREKIEKLKQSKFKQQTLPAWRPVPTAMSTMLTFSIFSVVFLAIGIVLYVMSDEIIEVVKKYDDQCDMCVRGNEKEPNVVCQPCNVMIDDFKQDVNEAIYVYYQLDNFYQNHRRYVKSRDNEQLQGVYKDVKALESACDPIVKVGDLWPYQKYSLKDKETNPTKMKDDDPAIPCGLVAKSFFDDTFELYKFKDTIDPTVKGYKLPKNDDPTTIGVKQDILSERIAWASDIEYKFKNIKKMPADLEGKEWNDIQWMSMEDEHFIVWMRTAGLPNFRKLWGSIKNGLKKGSYFVSIKNKYEVKPFQGTKSFVLSTTNALGGKNYFLAVCYITVGTLCLLFSFVFCFAYMKKQGNRPAQQ